jgi:hypothetical protein
MDSLPDPRSRHLDVAPRWVFTSKLTPLRRRRPQLLPYPPVAAAISPCGAGGVAVTLIEVSVAAVTNGPMSRRDRVTCGHRALRPRLSVTGAGWNDSPVVIRCPHCGSDRLIPLTFSPYRREDRHQGRSDEPVRRVAKCVSCGERISSRTTIREGLPSARS